ncbi:ABC-three component system protein [Thalassospira marina]|uniref:ABC-three component system protein n=1 Tax=Thalassospira marina TaxID=2048283 RepID=UPI003464676F
MLPLILIEKSSAWKKKLEQGNRLDLKQKAVRLKNRFDRKITKKQLSPVVQKVHLQVLSSIITAFDARVRPLIASNASQRDVDTAIHEYVILPAHKAIVRFNDLTTTEDVCGMLYFLTGKCHLVWSREC